MVSGSKRIIEIDRIDLPELSCYSSLTEAELRNLKEKGDGIFIAESPKVIEVAIQNGYKPLSMLCEARHITGDAAGILSRFPEIAVYTGSRETLSSLTGYKLTRGVLCAMRRKPLPSPKEIFGEGRSLICVMQGICDTTNIGSIFRSASALGVDGILLSEDTCDPLNRRAVRVSMGTVFTVPWTITADPIEQLKSAGFTSVALALRDDSLQLEDDRLKNKERLAVVFGTEGDGLPQKIIDSCDYVVKIPMKHGVDSLNVGAAAAVVFWELAARKNF